MFHFWTTFRELRNSIMIGNCYNRNKQLCCWFLGYRMDAFHVSCLVIHTTQPDFAAVQKCAFTYGVKGVM